VAPVVVATDAFVIVTPTDAIKFIEEHHLVASSLPLELSSGFMI